MNKYQITLIFCVAFLLSYMLTKNVDQQDNKVTEKIENVDNTHTDLPYTYRIHFHRGGNTVIQTPGKVYLSAGDAIMRPISLTSTHTTIFSYVTQVELLKQPK